MNQQEFCEAIAPMIAALGKSMSVDQAKAWHVLLDDLGPEALRRAVIVTIQEWTFGGFPPVGLIRKNAGAPTVRIEDRSAIAWSAIKRAIRTVGGYATVVFDDPIVTATVRGLGGWERFCSCPAGEAFDTWLRKEFEAMHRSLMAAGIDAGQAAPLPGLVEIDRSRSGHSLSDGSAVNPTLIELRLPPVSPALIRGAISQRPAIRLEGPTATLATSIGLSAPEDDEPSVEAATPPRDKKQAKQSLQAWAAERGLLC